MVAPFFYISIIFKFGWDILRMSIFVGVASEYVWLLLCQMQLAFILSLHCTVGHCALSSGILFK